jgi:N-acetylmuramoyl-L-alanine amidase
MQVAREHRADLFVSIHADAFKDPRVHGSSVYILSHNGASSEAARWLAEQENSADLVGGVSLDDKDDLLASVLLDLSQTGTMNASTQAGAQVLQQLKRLGKTHKRNVQRAGFVVLKSPDIPSILIETAFISNPDEERRLKDSAHQRELAKSITTGLRMYFETYAPPGTVLALRNHTISPGDTLSELAIRYQIPVNVLRTANELSGDQLQVGQVLHIPDSAGS